MTNKLTTNSQAIVTLQKTLNDLKLQLSNSQKRILELTKDKSTTKEELVKERQLLVELQTKYSAKQFETTDAIEEQITDWPDLVDSRPEKRFKSTGEWS
jgi:predicted  nucleic acid-binding Zn-ribbon protein